jgi:hypothetical protein
MVLNSTPIREAQAHGIPQFSSKMQALNPRTVAHI